MQLGVRAANVYSDAFAPASVEPGVNTDCGYLISTPVILDALSGLVVRGRRSGGRLRHVALVDCVKLVVDRGLVSR